MKKKSARADKHKSDAPQAAQMDAVRKLSRSGRYDEAKARLTELRTRFPDFKPLLALAWEVDDHAGEYLSASLHAWDWSMASPGSLAALEALRDSALAAALPALSASAAQRLAQTSGEAFPDLPLKHTPLADLSFEQAVALDLSRLFLGSRRIGDAIAVLEGIDHPSARNNLALAHFAQGEIALALAIFESNWQQDQRNLFALYYVIRLRLWRSGGGPAQELAAALRDAQPLRAVDAYTKMFGLLLLGLDEAAIATWQACREATFWTEFDARQCSDSAYFAGVAALRSGDRDAADKLFFEALTLAPDNLDAGIVSEALLLHGFGKEVEFKIGDFYDWLPQSWLDEIQAAKGEAAQAAVFDAQLHRCDAHADYLAVTAELGGAGMRLYAVSVLKLRALNGDNTAVDTLRHLLTRPCGPDQMRLDLEIWLQDSGFATAGQALPMLIRGELREIAFRPARVHAEPADLGLPPAEQAKLEKMQALLKQGELLAALRLAEELAAACPRVPILAGNIASLKESLGHDLDEVEAQFRRAVELDPAYFFGLAGLARIAARKGDVERAKELLKPLLGREEYHYSEWRALLMARRQIALEEKDVKAVLDWDAALEMVEEQFG